MKRLTLAVVIIATSMQLYAKEPIVMEIDNKPIKLSEFEYLYNKNNSSSVLEQKSIEEYVDLFVKFKLKVHDAEVKRLDTVASFQRELNGYRNQLAKPYLTDTELEDHLYEEAYSHFSQDCEVSHILFSLKPDATPADTLAAYKKALAAIKRLEKENFETVAKSVSEDQSVSKNGGYLGFFTALQTVWSFEKAMYDLPLNTISQPVRTNYGYHVIKVHSRRPAYGQIHAQHIMKLCNDKMTKTEQDNAFTQISNISSKIRNGGDFEELAKLFSDDKGTAKNGGDLSWFGINRMVTEFENAAFALKVNEISAPIKTQFGWHLIKVTDKRQAEPFEKKKADIHRVMQYDNRSTAALKSFIGKLKREYNFKINSEVENAVKAVIEENKANETSTLIEEGEKLTGVLCSFKNQQLTATDFIKYYSAQNGKLPYDKLFDQYVTSQLIAYEDKHLENKHSDFAHLVQEYHDGILLFEISNQEVWNKALVDTAGIVEFFNNNINSYVWDQARYKGLIVKCADKTTAKKVKKELKTLKDKSLIDSIANKYNTDSTTVVTIERGLWKRGDNQFVDKLGFKDKTITTTTSEQLPIVYLVGEQQTVPDCYTDVRGIVTADYQNHLEEEWIKSLEEKYTVVIYDDVIKKIKK